MSGKDSKGGDRPAEEDWRWWDTKRSGSGKREVKVHIPPKRRRTR
jgi:hypothetical protein